MKIRFIVVVLGCLSVASSVWAQSDSRSPVPATPTPASSINQSSPLPTQEMTPPMIGQQMPEPLQQQDSSSGELIDPGVSGGSSCLDCPSGEASGYWMDNGSAGYGYPQMSTPYSMDSSGGCSSCTGGNVAWSPSFSSSCYPSSGASSPGGYSPNSGNGFGMWGRGWGGGQWNRGSGWFGRRSCGCGY